MQEGLKFEKRELDTLSPLEQREYFDVHPEAIRPESATDFNNFTLRCFIDSNRGRISEWKETLREMEGRSYDETENGRQVLAYSDKRLDMTHKEFFEEVDEAAQVLKINVNRIRELYEKMHEERMGENKEEARRLMIEKNILQLPLYLELRRRGFSHYDLTG
ncbi:MAG: hypothetical protein AAB634_01750 [Patescibacteria group bacterium]